MSATAAPELSTVAEPKPKSPAEHLAEQVKDHQMKVLHDDGAYRHLRFATQGQPFYWFELVTWPDHLALTGDLGDYTFATRGDDPLAFFACRGDIDDARAGYWTQKLVAHSEALKEYSPERLISLVTEHWGRVKDDYEPEEREIIWAAITEQLIDEASDESAARSALYDSIFGGFYFHDAWEWDLTSYTFRYHLALNAVAWGARKYRAERAAAAASA